MAIKFQYNKTSLQHLDKQLKVRKRALPTLKNKESALRSEVKRAKDKAATLEEEFDKEWNKYTYMVKAMGRIRPIVNTRRGCSIIFKKNCRCAHALVR